MHQNSSTTKAIQTGATFIPKALIATQMTSTLRLTQADSPLLTAHVLLTAVFPKNSPVAESKYEHYFTNFMESHSVRFESLTQVICFQLAFNCSPMLVSLIATQKTKRTIFRRNKSMNVASLLNILKSLVGNSILCLQKPCQSCAEEYRDGNNLCLIR